MPASSTPCEIRIERANDLVSLFIEEMEGVTEDSQYDPIRLLVRIIARQWLESPDCAIVGGPRFVEWFKHDLDELSWKLGETYVQTFLGVWQGLTIRSEPVSWFFQRAPEGFSDMQLDQAFVNDSICLLSRYQGPKDLDSILRDLRKTASQEEILRVLMQHCESVFIVNDDGGSAQIVIRNQLDNHLMDAADLD
jgi:hypothetical protein